MVAQALHPCVVLDEGVHTQGHWEDVLAHSKALGQHGCPEREEP